MALPILQIGLGIVALRTRRSPVDTRLCLSMASSLPGVCAGVAIARMPGLDADSVSVNGWILLSAMLLLPLAGGVALWAALPLDRNNGWAAASRLCGVLPPWAGVYATFQVALGA